MASAVGVLWVTFLAIFCPFCVAEYGKRNLTLFHVNPIRYTGISNMNLADVQGDAFFTMRSIGLPKLCRNKSEDWHVCDNPEAAGNDRVITKAIVEVENKFDPYSTCNICVNGSAPSSNPPAPCTIGEYVCTCYVKGTDLRKICNETLVGREDVNSSHGHIIPGFPSFFTWQANLAYRLGGFWYSTTSAGKDRSWRLAEESRRVNASCLGDLIMKKIRNRFPNPNLNPTLTLTRHPNPNLTLTLTL
ncbi:hypothetical protein AAMO2058_000055800, partial [Amorphochlora amoebiformis]